MDNLVLDLHLKNGFPATVIRPSYICGPGLLPLDNLGGRRDDFISDILEGKPLDLPNDGQALLHPVHVRDLAAAFRLAIERPCSIGEIYNVCLPRAVTLTRYLEITAAALNREVTINRMPVKDILDKYGSEIDEIGLHFLATHMCFDISKARDELGYEPHGTTEEAIIETVRWAAASSG